MGLVGNLKTMQLSDLLQWCAFNSKTGTLRLHHPPIVKRLFFKEGRLFSSTSNNPRERLSQFLIRSGIITEEQLVQALVRQQRTRQPLGEVLIGFGWLDPAELARLLKLKTEESIYDCFLWNDGEFKFLDDQLPEEIAVLVAENLTNIVFEGVRRADEWRRIREVFPSLQITFKVNEDAAASAAVPEKDRRVLSLVRKGRTIAEIALEMHAVNFYAASRLWKFHQQGLISIDRIWQEIPLEQQVQELNDLMRQGAASLKAGRLAEARAAFEKALCKDPRDKYAHLLLIKVRQMMKCAKEVEVFSRDSVLVLKAPAPPIERLDLDPKECFVLSRINGKWDVESIIKLCPMREKEVVASLRHLLDCSLVEVKSLTEAAPPLPASSADSLETAGEPF